MSILKPSDSVVAGLATGAVVWGVFAVHGENFTKIHGNAPGNDSVEMARKVSTWTAAAIVIAVYFMTGRDTTVAVIGGGSIVALDFSHRWANAVTPGVNKVLNQVA